MKSTQRVRYLLVLIALLGLNLAFTQSSGKQNDFEASQIVAAILSEVGSLEFNTSNTCQILETRLVKMYDNIACQKAAQKVSDAQKAIDKIMINYKIKAVSEWSVSEAGASRIFISKGQKETQSINIFVTNNLILLGY